MKYYTNVTRKGNSLLVRGVGSDGSRLEKKIKYKPILFSDDNSGQNSGLTNLKGGPVSPVFFDSISDARAYIEQYKDVHGFSVYGTDNYPAQWVGFTYKNEIECSFDEIVYLNFDMETGKPPEGGFPEPEQASADINVIVANTGRGKPYHVFTTLECNETWNPDNIKVPVILHRFDSEEELLIAFLDFWSSVRPDIISGWNISKFDIPYLYNRCLKFFPKEYVELKLSPWGIITFREYFDPKYQKNVTKYNIHGVANLDMIELYKKFTFSVQESYSLDYISKVELGVGKLLYSGSIFEFQENDPQRFVEYAIVDVHRVQQIDEKNEFMQLACQLSYTMRLPNFEDVFGTVKPWEIFIYNYLLKKGIVDYVGRPGTGEKKEKYEGAFVGDPIPGKYKWVASFDAASLYPSIIMGLNISPETFVGMDHSVSVERILETNARLLPEDDWCVAANGACFRKDIHGFLPEMMRHLFDKRKIVKSEMIEKQKILEKTETNDPGYSALKDKIASLDNTQMATKIALNSLYGALGTPSFRYFDIRLAEAITVTGKAIIQWGTKHTNSYLKNSFPDGNAKTVYGDTDSIFLELEEVVSGYKGTDDEKHDKIMTFIKSDLSPAIDTIFTVLMKKVLNCYDQTIVFKLEAIAASAIWTAKKRYCMSVLSSEGVRYSKPKTKVKGLESVRSSTPEICRNAFNKAFEIMLTGTNEDLIEYVNKFRDEFMNSDLKAIAKPSGVSDVKKWLIPKGFKSGTPMHVRAAINYNRMVERLNLRGSYRTIDDGDKLRFVPLRMPNSLGDDVIAFIDDFPPEFGLEKYVNKNLQFDKTFLTALEDMAKIAGMKVEETNSLDVLGI